MTSPSRFLLRIFLFLIAVIISVFIIYDQLYVIFTANTILNSFIVAVFFVGVILNIRQVLMLSPEIAWIERFQKDRTSLKGASPKLLASLAVIVKESRDPSRIRISTSASKSILDSINSRLEEGRDISRYFIGLAIFLGLLGTFWGLMATIASVGDVVSGLNVSDENLPSFFENLKQGLKAPLEGMGTAFSSSLLGLSSSLVLGFLDLQASQAQNMFFNELDEWLTSFTHSYPVSVGDDAVGGGKMPAYIQALIEEAIDSINEINRTFARAEDRWSISNKYLLEINHKLSALPRLDEVSKDNANSVRQELQILQNIDKGLTRISQDIGREHDAFLRELRNEIKLLARTLAVPPTNFSSRE